MTPHPGSTRPGLFLSKDRYACPTLPSLTPQPDGAGGARGAPERSSALVLIPEALSFDEALSCGHVLMLTLITLSFERAKCLQPRRAHGVKTCVQNRRPDMGYVEIMYNAEGEALCPGCGEVDSPAHDCPPGEERWGIEDPDGSIGELDAWLPSDGAGEDRPF